jgi:pimeloyl-ACP methyl ester carboxylesterase|tara:strand:+ start:126 stop:872 length:747 start_codon:yes stop_codon:yes gene_type:complete
MTNFNYFKISKSKKIRYLKYFRKKATYIVFLHGFMSDLEGNKPKAFYEFAKKNNLGFLALEYSGHGKSYGKFIDGNISSWSKDVKILIKKIVRNNKMILVGSSMGSWISLNQFKYFKKKICGFLGIGSAPEFLEHLMWKKFSIRKKREIVKKGIINLKHGDYEYPITYQLIKDGRKNKILNKKINQNIKVTMIHGSKDKSVPVIYSKKILEIFKSKKKKLVIIKNGDHSLSSPKWLNILKKELELIIN